jgi:hypothetical protein
VKLSEIYFLFQAKASDHTGTSEPVDGNGAQNMVTVQNQRPFNHWPTNFPTALTSEVSEITEKERERMSQSVRITFTPGMSIH